jgi:hypothetical protein
MGYTVTIETNNDLDSRYLYDIVSDYFKDICPEELDKIKYMSNNPKEHPYVPKDIERGLSITFSTLSNEAFFFITNVGKCSALTLQTRLFYDDEEVEERNITWPKNKRKIFWFLENRLYQKEMRTIAYFENEVVEEIRTKL